LAAIVCLLSEEDLFSLFTNKLTLKGSFEIETKHFLVITNQLYFNYDFFHEPDKQQLFLTVIQILGFMEIVFGDY